MGKELGSGLDNMFLLKSLELFKGLDMEDIYSIIKVSNFKQFAVNTVVVKKGDTIDTFCLLLKGELGVFADKGENTVRTIRPEELALEPGVFEGIRNTSTVKALKDSIILEVASEDFIGLLSGNGRVAVCFVKILGSSLRNVLEASSKETAI